MKGELVNKILKKLHDEYGNPRTALKYSSPLELLVSVILSARTTDKQVNKVTPDLFKKYKTPEDYANVDLEELQEDLNSIGFYNQKAKWIQKSARKIIEDFDGKVPDNMEDLLTLTGVARKTANVVLQNAFDTTVGVVVDTHVKRVGERLGLHNGGKPDDIEKQLMNNLPKNEWVFISHALIEHGRATCKARKPQCPDCVVKDLCPSADKLIKKHWS